MQKPCPLFPRKRTCAVHDHPNRMRVLPTENNFDNSCFIGLGLVGFNISAAEVIYDNQSVSFFLAGVSRG